MSTILENAIRKSSVFLVFNLHELLIKFSQHLSHISSCYIVVKINYLLIKLFNLHDLYF
jgi:hypothetical protein